MNAASAFEPVWELTRRIPRGRVATYGLLSRLLGGRVSPRFVGWAVHAASAARPPVPWHRIVSHDGRLSVAALADGSERLQRALLEREGVAFDDHGRVRLERHLWRPRSRERTRRGRHPRTRRR
jgi:methylated-DNA-protein-cysteine methyltransferase-like protein